MRQNFYKYITFFLIIFAIWLGGVPFFFSKAVPIICENLSYNTEYKISIKNPKLYLNIIPVATVKAENIEIKHKKDTISINDLNLKIRILPLISGRLHINKIYATDINLNVFFDKTTELDKDLATKIKKAKVNFDCADIKNINFKFYENNPNNIAIYSSKNLFFKQNGRFFTLITDSNISVDNTQSAIKLDIRIPQNNDIKKSKININISNLNITPFFCYLKNFLPDNLINAKGIIDIDINKQHLNAYFKNVKILMKDNEQSIIFPEKLKIDSDLNMTSKTITIDNAQIKSKNIDVVVNGTLSNYLKSIPQYFFNIRINQSKAEDFINMSPVFKTEDIDMYKLKHYKFYGDVLGNISIKGHNLEPNVNGSIYINNVVLITPIPNAKCATIKLDFKGKSFNYDVNVPAGHGEKVFVLGNTELYNIKYADLRVWSTKNVNLATAQAKVVPLSEILNFIIGPVPIMDIKGIGNIDIKIKGNRKNPHIWGVFNLNDTTAFFNDFPSLILTKADAVLTFDDENVTFKLNKGLLNGNTVNIGGTSTLAGVFDFDVTSNNQNLGVLLNALKNSTIIDGIKNMVTIIDNADGLTNIKTKVYGNIIDINDIKFNKNFFIKGSLELLDNIIEANNIKMHNSKGIIKFQNTNADLYISSFIEKSPAKIKLLIKDNIADANIHIPKLNLKDVIQRNDKFRQDIANIFLEIDAKYKGRVDSIEYDKIDFVAKILEVEKNNKLKLSKGIVTLKNNKLFIKNLNGVFTNTNSMFNINMQINNISTTPICSGNILLKDFELNIINMFSEYLIIPNNIRKIIKQIHFDKGKVNINAKISDNNINASSNIGGLEFTHTPTGIPIKIINGSIYIRKNFLGLNKINLIADNMPVLIDGGIDNIFTKQDFNLYINSKPNQEFIDKYINNNRIYPIKIKGDIVYWLKLKGTKDNIDMLSEADLSKESSIYYLGATIGDLENSIVLNLNMDIIEQHLLKIKEFSYDKIIDSQGKRKTRLNMLKASGGINVVKDDFIFHDFKVKTSHPTDARIFNILFKKPNIKQGQFTSDLKFNGKLSNPNLLGTFHIVETNIPFLDTTMKNLLFIFKERTIELSSSGEVLGNDIKFKGTLLNKLTPPYIIENAELYTKILDLNYITNKLKISQVDNDGNFDALSDFDIKKIVVKNLKLKADEIKLRNLSATNVEAVAAISDKNIFNINNFKFSLSDGYITGKFKYNMNNNDIGITLNTNNINANDITIALFDLSNQMYGSLTGNVNLSCNGSEYDKCMETLNGSLSFNVKDGKMPKLGSLEYLLKAGNLIKGGITSVSINSVIDILSPLKTGNFSDIYGRMTIQNGITKDIEISTKGKNLNLFITGNYNFGSSNAEMEVFGLLSKKISTMFGPLGNVSLNTLFNIVPGIDLSKNSTLLDKINKIPAIELNSKDFRKFFAEINGNINGDNYVRSFQWIN